MGVLRGLFLTSGTLKFFISFPSPFMEVFSLILPVLVKQINGEGVPLRSFFFPPLCGMDQSATNAFLRLFFFLSLSSSFETGRFSLIGSDSRPFSSGTQERRLFFLFFFNGLI